ncbi:MULTISPECIES: DUF4142 domain-containing protein [Sphingobium]|uniref:DUF4142 domain-containing protein n=1 Tax=Sphingobium TaxID=165695 RepID=UPI001BE87756|nr:MULTISPECIES: DUF4142 domain-containing protein [Sphingobium]MBT2246378.1 DUF4142 domain-containing protein [Sphingobium sp. BHU LFT2]WBQ19000.1 DUF4142 domain-containing protein [Sphingobium yanoikuyae]
MLDTAGGVFGQIGAATTVADDALVNIAALGGQYEIRSVRIALERSWGEPVRTTALQTIADRTACTRYLQAATEMNEIGDIAMSPVVLDQRRPSMRTHLEASHYAVDKIYLNQVMGHQESVTLMLGNIRTHTNLQRCSAALSGGPVFERYLKQMKTLHAAL